MFLANFRGVLIHLKATSASFGHSRRGEEGQTFHCKGFWVHVYSSLVRFRSAGGVNRFLASSP